MTPIDRKQHVKADGRQQNKDKPKKGHLPQDMIDEGRYLAAHTVSDVWICYPWEATYVNHFFVATDLRVKADPISV